MVEEYEFITDDKSLREKREKDGLGQGDRAIFQSMQTGDGLIEIKSVEQFKALAQAASDRFDGLREIVKVMTHDQALFIRMLRVDKGYTWRAVAEACYVQNWEGYDREQWAPPSNQLMGMALCEKAAEFFGEDYEQPPWN